MARNAALQATAAEPRTERFKVTSLARWYVTFGTDNEMIQGSTKIRYEAETGLVVGELA
jgi:hypothetical protein